MAFGEVPYNKVEFFYIFEVGFLNLELYCA